MARHRQPQTMSDQERLEVIVGLRRRGVPWARVGRAVGLSANGAKYAWMRAVDPAGYRQKMPGQDDE